MKRRRILAFGLSLAMLLPLFQVQTSAAIGELSISADTVGQYSDGKLSDRVPGMFMNGSLKTWAGGAPKVEQYWFNWWQKADIPTGRFVNENGYPIKVNNKEVKVSDYNMIMAFGMKGNAYQEPQSGFSYSDKMKINASAIALGGYDEDLWYKKTATIRIQDNPQLFALAQSGDLEFYFSGFPVGAKADGCEDGKSFLKANISLNYTELASVDYAVEKRFFSTGGFKKLTPYSVITISMETVGDGCNRDEWAKKDVGIEDAILLFRKASCPNLTTYTLTSNGDRSVVNGTTQALLGKNGKLDLEFSFSEPVKTALNSVNMNDGNGQILKALANRTLFANTPGTGYPNQNNEVYMKLTSVNNISDRKIVTRSEYAQYNALKDFVKLLHYTWTPGVGDFYGDNPLPNEGDWAGKVSSSNTYNLLEMISYASFHDAAGNPLLINGKNYTASDNFDNTSLQGTIGLNGGFVKRNANNPFTYTNDDYSGFDFVIDTVDPAYSSTSNPVQPNILSKLTLNKNDSFEIDLNYAKAVRLRTYFEDGRSTGYSPANLEILFTNGMTAKYKSGLGTKVLTFTVDVPGDESINTRTLEVKELRVKTGTKYDTNNIIVDYVGNPLKQRLGNASIRTTMSGSNLSVDNTIPVIKIDRATEDSFRVNITDNMDVKDGSGNVTKSAVFHVANATGEDNGSGLFYYVWVNGDTEKEQAIKDLTANNYAMLKKASLGVPVDDYKIKQTNNNALIDIPAEVQNGGKWFLLVFSADMTWDSARQLIQYGKASYKTKPDEYYCNLMNALGVKLDGDMFTELTKKPADWNENYKNYYTKEGIVFTKVPEGDKYPDFNKGAYYEYKFAPLTSETPPANWEKEYTKYFTKEGDNYYSVPETNGIPKWRTNKYYTSYNKLTDENAPENWLNELLTYSIRENNNYITIAEKNAPKFTPNSFYEKIEDELNIGEFIYVPLTSEPENWKNTYYNYYVQDCIDFNRVIGSAPAFIPDYFYKRVDGNYVVLETKPEDWETSFAKCYYKESPFVEEYSRVRGHAPLFEYQKYCKLTFSPEYQKLDSMVWKDRYKMYFDREGSEYVCLKDYVPLFEIGKYYSSDGTTYTPLTERPEDWDKNYSSYYTSTVVNENVYYLPVTEYPVYQQGKYYSASFDELTEEPKDWAETFDTYYEIPSITYTKVIDKMDLSAYEYTPNKYFKKIERTLLEEKPDDWDSAFTYYERENGERLQRLTCAEYEKDYYYTNGVEQLKVEPENWPKEYKKYYIFDNESQEYETARATEDNMLEIIPEYVDGQFYGGSDGVKNLSAGRFSDAKKEKDFMAAMLDTKDSNEQVEVIRGYSEFANEVYLADVKTMELAADYQSWSNGDFSKDDSNWTYSVVSTEYDKTPPTVSLAESGVLNDNSENVSLPIIIDDEKNGIAKVEYQLASKGTAISVDTNFGWIVKELGNADSHQEIVIDSESYAKVYGIADGEYDVYVRAADTLDNIGCSNKLATIKINTKVDIKAELSKPKGKSPYSKISNVNLTVSGNVSGSNVLDCGLKAYYAFDENYSKSDAEGWTELTGENGIYAVPELGGVSGSYYLHIKYEYTSAGNTVQKYLNEFYSMDGVAGDITFNQVGFSDTSLSIELQAKNADKIYYLISDDITKEITESATGWILLPATNTVEILKEQYPGVSNVRLWAKVDDIVRSEVYNLGANGAVSGNLPTPSVNLVGLLHENKEYNAIVKLDANEEMLDSATEYSYAVADSKTSVSDLTWHRWVPYESMVNVNVGDSVNNKYLYFKFKNGTNITEEKDYIIIKSLKSNNDAAWVTVNRNTFKNVSPATGVQLQFVCKDGYSVEGGNEVTENANGLYKYNILDKDGANCGNVLVSVNNVDTTPPGYSLEWGDGGVHTATSGNVRVTVKTTEDVTFQDVEFTSQSGEVTHPTAINTYNFKENGVCKFTFADEVGNVSVATAKVTWIDLSKPEFDIIPDYTDYITVGGGSELYASGVKLVLRPKKVDSFVSNGTDSEETFFLDVTENGTYTFSMGDSLGNYVTKTYTVSNLLTGQEAPKVVEQKVEDGKVVVKLAGTIKGYASGNRLFDGRSNKGTEVKATNSDSMTTYTCNSNGEYTITKRYSSNGNVCTYICDSLGYAVPVDIQVEGLDTIKPVITLPESALQINKGATLDQNWWKENVTFTDNITSLKDLKVTTDIKVDTKITGAYAVVLNVEDNSGNKASVKTTLYVVPTDGMIVMSDKGVLFSSSSKDAALIDGNTIKLTVKNFDLVKYQGKDVSNKLATYSIIVKKGLFREGQMKYFDTRINNLTFTQGKKYSTVLIDTNLLTGTGWYTIIIRTAERDREYTTFFISE